MFILYVQTSPSLASVVCGITWHWKECDNENLWIRVIAILKCGVQWSPFGLFEDMMDMLEWARGCQGRWDQTHLGYGPGADGCFADKMRSSVFAFQLWNQYAFVLFLPFFLFSFPHLRLRDLDCSLLSLPTEVRGFWHQHYKLLILFY